MHFMAWALLVEARNLCKYHIKVSTHPQMHGVFDKEAAEVERWCHWSEGDKMSLKSRQMKGQRLIQVPRPMKRRSSELGTEAPARLMQTRVVPRVPRG